MDNKTRLEIVTNGVRWASNIITELGGNHALKLGPEVGDKFRALLSAFYDLDVALRDASRNAAHNNKLFSIYSPNGDLIRAEVVYYCPIFTSYHTMLNTKRVEELEVGETCMIDSSVRDVAKAWNLRVIDTIMKVKRTR